MTSPEPEVRVTSVKPLREPCWVVRVDGAEVDLPFGGVAHYSHAEAVDEVDDREDEGAVAKPYGRACFTVACAACEGPFDLDADEACVFHFDSVTAALNAVVGADWQLIGDSAYCPGCPQPDPEEDDDQS